MHYSQCGVLPNKVASHFFLGFSAKVIKFLLFMIIFKKLSCVINDGFSYSDKLNDRMVTGELFVKMPRKYSYPVIIMGLA
jgi:hypothetical protein